MHCFVPAIHTQLCLRFPSHRKRIDPAKMMKKLRTLLESICNREMFDDPGMPPWKIYVFYSQTWKNGSFTTSTHIIPMEHHSFCDGGGYYATIFPPMIDTDDKNRIKLDTFFKNSKSSRDRLFCFGLELIY